MATKRPIEQWLDGLPEHLHDSVPLLAVLSTLAEDQPAFNFTLAVNVLTPEGWGTLLANAAHTIVNSYAAKGADPEDVGNRMLDAFEHGLDNPTPTFQVARGPVN